LGRLEASVRPRSEIAAREIAEMFALYDRYYGGAGEDAFRDDLAAKSHVIELRDADVLRGFSTVALQPFECAGEQELALFSGDTIIDHAYWGEQALAKAFCRFAGEVSAEHPGTRLYWFLISKGYRTYRYLHAFARRYFPHPDAPTPQAMQQRMDVLARARFGDAYLPERGIVRFEPARGFLRHAWGGVRDGLRERAEVRYFLERNPGHASGDELVCLTELTHANLRSVAAREFAEGRRERCALGA